MDADSYDITLKRGKTWIEPLQRFGEPIGGEAAISNSAASPTVITTAVSHGLATGDWVIVRGTNSNPKVDGVHQVTVVDATHFSVPMNCTAAGTTGSVRKAKSVAGYSARMKVRDGYGGTELLSLTNGAGITLGGDDGKVTLTRSAAETAAFSWKRGVYDIELEIGGVVEEFLSGTIEVGPEATT